MRTLAALLVALYGLVAPAHLRAQPVDGLHLGDMAQIRAVYKGKPLVLHVWSLTCTPCLAEFPTWARRIRQYPNVAFVFINTDGVPYAAAQARRLQAAGVKPARALVYADDFVERLQYEIAPDWHGEMPRTELTLGSGHGLITLGPVSDVVFRQWVRQSAP